MIYLCNKIFCNFYKEFLLIVNVVYILEEIGVKKKWFEDK